MREMQAKYAGKCTSCKLKIEVGETILWSRQTGAICVECREDLGNQQLFTVPVDAKGVLAGVRKIEVLADNKEDAAAVVEMILDEFKVKA